MGSLKLRCMQTISSKYELICYGCSERSQMNKLLDADDEDFGFMDIPGPFIDLPSSLLEELMRVIYDLRGLPKETLHQIILHQLQGYTVQMRASRHIQTQLIGERCKKLKSLDFVYTSFFKKFPNLVKINLQGTIID